MKWNTVGIVVGVVVAVVLATGPPWWWHYLSSRPTGSLPPQATGPTGSASTPTGSASTLPKAKWTDVPTSSWRTFGIAQVAPEANSVMRITFGQNITIANKWAGVIANVSRSCDYSIRMQVRVVSLVGSQGGYGVGSGELSANSLPEGTAFQYDFGFGGYRVLNYPNDWQQPYQYVGASLDQQWHSIYIAFDKEMTAYVDGGVVVLSRTSSYTCGVPIIRVWAASIEVRNVQVQTATN